VVGGATGNGIHTRATRPVASFEVRVAGGDVSEVLTRRRL